MQRPAKPRRSGSPSPSPGSSVPSWRSPTLTILFKIAAHTPGPALLPCFPCCPANKSHGFSYFLWGRFSEATSASCQKHSEHEGGVHSSLLSELRHQPRCGPPVTQSAHPPVSLRLRCLQGRLCREQQRLGAQEAPSFPRGWLPGGPRFPISF